MPYGITQARPNPRQKVSSSMPSTGQNEVTLPQALTPDQATLIDNYFIERQFELARRNGSKKLAQVASNENASKVLKQWTESLIILGYGTVLSVFNINDNTINTIKSNFSANLTDGLRWGNDFYSCNGRLGDRIFKTTLPTLAYDTQTANYTVGLTITGGTSGATATIISDADSGATGTLTLDNINGVFQVGETLTDSSTGSADVTSVVDYTNTASIPASTGTVPKCEALNVFNNQLHAISTDNDFTEAHAAKVNDFTAWDPASNSGDPYRVIFSRAGQATDMGNLQNTATGSESFGDVGVIFYKDGIYAFTNEVRDVGGTLTQFQKEFFQKLDDGGERGVLSTKFGIFYGNENGEFLLKTDGTSKHLSETFSKDTISKIDNTDSDRVLLPERDLMMVTLRFSSSKNNRVYWFDTKTLNRKKVNWGIITGWAVERFLVIGRTLYGGSSTSPKVLNLLADDVWDDEGSDVYWKTMIPFNFGQLESLKDISRFDIGGYLSALTNVKIEIFGIDEQGGDLISTGISYTFSGSGSSGNLAEFGDAEFGGVGFGDLESGEATNWKESTGWLRPNSLFKAYVIVVSGNDKLEHTLAYMSILGSEGRLQRRNVLSIN